MLAISYTMRVVAGWHRRCVDYLLLSGLFIITPTVRSMHGMENGNNNNNAMQSVVAPTPASTLQQPLCLKQYCLNAVMLNVLTGKIQRKSENLFSYNGRDILVDHKTSQQLTGNHLIEQQQFLSSVKSVTYNQLYALKNKYEIKRNYFTPCYIGEDVFISSCITVATREHKLLQFTTTGDGAVALSPGGIYAFKDTGNNIEVIQLDSGQCISKMMRTIRSGSPASAFIGDTYIVLEEGKTVKIHAIDGTSLTTVGKNEHAKIGAVMHHAGALIVKHTLSSHMLRYKYVTAANSHIISKWLVQGDEDWLEVHPEVVDENSNLIGFYTACDGIQISTLPSRSLEEDELLPTQAYIKHPGNIQSAAFGNNGQWFMTSGSYANGLVCLWDWHNNQLLAQLNLHGFEERLPITILSWAGNRCLIRSGEKDVSSFYPQWVAAAERMRKYRAADEQQHKRMKITS